MTLYREVRWAWVLDAETERFTDRCIVTSDSCIYFIQDLKCNKYWNPSNISLCFKLQAVGAVIKIMMISFALQISSSSIACPRSGNSLSRGTNRLDTSARCWLHLWRHWVASSRDIEGRYPGARNLIVHRTSNVPSRTANHHHHLKVGIHVLRKHNRDVYFVCYFFCACAVGFGGQWGVTEIERRLSRDWYKFSEERSYFFVFQRRLAVPYCVVICAWGWVLVHVRGTGCLVTSAH
jgi:hypothetical protein